MNKKISSKVLTPVVQKEKGAVTMSFPDAMYEVLRGNKVTRVSWGSENEYGILKNGWLSIFTRGQMYTWTVSEADIEGNDWVVIK